MTREEAVLRSISERAKASAFATPLGDRCVCTLNPAAAAQPQRAEAAASLQQALSALSLSALRRATAGQRQAICATGESGSGKTEAIKLIISSLADSSSSVLVASTPLLEAIGCSSTTHNR